MKLILKYFADAVRRFRAAFMWPLFIMLVMAALSAATPYLFRLFADGLSDDVAYFVAGILIFGVYLLAQTLLKMLWAYLSDGFGGRYIEALTLKMQSALISADGRRLDEAGRDNLKHTIYYDVLSVYSVIAVQLPLAIRALIVTLAAMTVGFFFGAFVTAIILAAFVLGVLLSYVSRKMIASASRRTNRKMKEYNAASSQFVDGITHAKVNALGPYYAANTARSIQNFIKTAKGEDVKTYFWHGIVENYNQLFSIVLSALLALPFAGGSIVNLVFFTMLADIIMTQGMGVQTGLLSIMKTRPAFENVDGVLRMREEDGALELNKISEIKFENVDFAYFGGENVLEDFNCTFKSGVTYRIVGANGSGKSTIARMICGIYRPLGGKILFDGVSWEELSRKSLAENILYLAQEEPMLDGGVREYLSALSGSEVGEEHFQRLCSAAGLDGDIVITRAGQGLSPGQRKKIMIMKYLLLRASRNVVVLDEVFAGLDIAAREHFAAILCADMAARDKIYIFIEHEDISVPADETITL